METHPTINWPAAPSWSLQLGTAGQLLTAGAALLFLLAVIASISKKEKLASGFFISGTLAIFAAFADLLALLIFKQYHFKYVFDHCDNSMALGYRISALWGGQEGSFLLWATASGLFGLLSMGFTKSYQRWYLAVYGLFMAFLAAILTYESPFGLIPFEGKALLPPNGAGLNASLLNYWMQIHPPVIFLGFGSLTVLFAWSMSAMISRNLSDWIALVRPWAIISLTLTGIGLCMGGLWAYETLGWGGFWKWDPVENASLVPWLLVASFLHLIFINRRLPVTTAVFGALGLVSFLYGTFLTRSGFLGDSSVHSFAEMDSKALIILQGLILVAVLSLVGVAINAARGVKAEAARPASTVFNLNNAYSLGSILLTTLAIASAIGMSVPLIMSLQGQKPRVVDEVIYNRVSSWMFIPIIVLMAFGPYLNWRGHRGRDLLNRISSPFFISVGVLGLGLLVMRQFPLEFSPDRTAKTIFFGTFGVATYPWVIVLTFFCLFTIFANLYRFAEHWKSSKTSAGAFLMHVGVALTMLGLIVSRGLERKAEFTLQQGSSSSALGYSVALTGMDNTFLDRENRVHLTLKRDNETIEAKPTLFYIEMPNTDPQPVFRPEILRHPLYDLYITVHPFNTEATEPTPFKPGESKGFENYQIHYREFFRDGEPGKAGTKFGAVLDFTDSTGKKTTVRPAMAISDSGPEFAPAQVGDDYFVYVNRVDAASKEVTLQLHYVSPIFPAEVFYKPLPGMILLGMGIMLVGGIVAATVRWKGQKSRPEAVHVPTEVEQPVALV